MRRILRGLALVVAGAAFLVAPAVLACPFCMQEASPTLIADFQSASAVLYGTFTNAKLAPGGVDGGVTDFVIEEVLKPHEIVQGKKELTLPRYLPGAKNKFIIYCDVFKGQIDPIRGVEVASNSELVDYLKGAIALKDAPASKRLRYCFEYLNSADLEVAMDAYREYAKADYEDYRDMATTLPADRISGWLKDPKTPAYRYGLYGSLIGQCGTSEHARVLRTMLDDQKIRRSSGIDGLLVGYAILLKRHGEADKGLAYLREILDNPEEEFLMRHAVLRSLRFFYNSRPDVFAKDELVNSVELTLKHADMADFGIEDLRKWQRWDADQRVLDLFGLKSHDVPIIRRAVLRYALQCPTPLARDFVRRQESADREWVDETRELLALESPAPTGETAKK